MHPSRTPHVWIDRGIAVAFATVAVGGFALVGVTLSMFFPEVDLAALSFP